MPREVGSELSKGPCPTTAADSSSWAAARSVSSRRSRTPRRAPGGLLTNVANGRKLLTKKNTEEGGGLCYGMCDNISDPVQPLRQFAGLWRPWGLFGRNICITADYMRSGRRQNEACKPGEWVNKPPRGIRWLARLGPGPLLFLVGVLGLGFLQRLLGPLPAKKNQPAETSGKTHDGQAITPRGQWHQACMEYSV